MNMFQDGKGDISMMRVCVFSAILLGTLIIFVGLIGWIFINKPDAGMIIGSGVGLITISVTAKAWQSQSENR